MKNCINLDKLNIGESCVVESLNCSNKLRKYFLNLGIIEGTYISAAFKSPFNNPVAYDIRNKLIAIRNQDANKIMVKTIKNV
ncbi:MAG: FeoA family protein [Clostridia bacterium]|nr:FeoA family protein [Clostridia bacterium]